MFKIGQTYNTYAGHPVEIFDSNGAAPYPLVGQVTAPSGKKYFATFSMDGRRFSPESYRFLKGNQWDLQPAV